MNEATRDRELMVRFSRRGDEGAYEELLGRWDRRVLGYLAKAAGDLEAAEDLRQEVFIRVYRYAKSYDPRYAFSTWLFRIASNSLKTWQKRQGRRREISLSAIEEKGFDPPDQADGPRERAARAEGADQVRASLAALDPEDRELLLLRFDHEMSYREIGQIMDTPETTIKSRVYKLFSHLRTELAEANAPGRM